MIVVVLVVVLFVILPIIVGSVLYVMVIGFGTSGSSTPAGSWNSAQAMSETTGRLTFGFFTEDVAPMDVRIFVTADGSSIGSLTITSNTGSTPRDIMWIGGPLGAEASYFDYNPAGGLINSGDYISFTGLESDTTYSFELFHIPSDSTISMTGISAQFTTP